MITILLYGHLATLFGKYHRMAVSSPAEAVRALKANFDGFEKALIGHAAGYHVFRGRENLGKDQIKEPNGRDAIRIVPVVAGAKSGGVLQIIEGIVLIVVAAVYFYFTGDEAGALKLGTMGALMIVGGVAQLLFAPPTAEKTSDEADKNKPSYVFNGPVNTTAQGHPVPVGYGRLRVGSAVISGGIYLKQIAEGVVSDDGGGEGTGGSEVVDTTGPSTSTGDGSAPLRAGDTVYGMSPQEGGN